MAPRSASWPALFGAVVWQVLAIPVTIIMGPIQTRMLERVLDTGDVPENMRQIFETLQQNTGFSIAGFILGSVFTLFISVIFSTLGGLLGAALFRKRLPPPPPLPPDLPGDPGGTALPGSSYDPVAPRPAGRRVGGPFPDVTH